MIRITSSNKNWGFVEIKDGFASHFYLDIKKSGSRSFVLTQTLGPTAKERRVLKGSLLECLEKAFELVQELPKQFYSAEALSQVDHPW